MELPYVADAYVLGVPYHEARQLCGAVVRLRSEISDNKVDLARIRDDLSHDMATYMLPVVLRILKGGEELPRTVSGKPVGREILSKFFGTTVSLPVEDLPQGVEYCGCTPVIDEETTRPWD